MHLWLQYNLLVAGCTKPNFPGSVVSPSSRLEIFFPDISSLENDNAAFPRKVGVRMSDMQPYIKEEHIVDYRLLLAQKQNLDSHIFKVDARRKQLWHDGRLITEDRDFWLWKRRQLVSLYCQRCSSDADYVKKMAGNSKTICDFFLIGVEKYNSKYNCWPILVRFRLLVFMR